jgi:hypothetical protein
MRSAAHCGAGWFPYSREIMQTARAESSTRGTREFPVTGCQGPVAADGGGGGYAAGASDQVRVSSLRSITKPQTPMTIQARSVGRTEDQVKGQEAKRKSQNGGEERGRRSERGTGRGLECEA